MEKRADFIEGADGALFISSPSVRWITRDGERILQQAWVSVITGREIWEDVPEEELEDIDKDP